jgi:hypothetical protein
MIVLALASGDEERARLALDRARRRCQTLEYRWVQMLGQRSRRRSELLRLWSARCAFLQAVAVFDTACRRYTLFHFVACRQTARHLVAAQLALATHC